MQIVRFDDEVSVPLTDAGSVGKAGALVEAMTGARVDVLHLPPGGRVGRQVAATPRLVAVVAGSGWVGGGDATHRAIATGYGALWEAGEHHEMGTDAGLRAVCIEGAFEMRAIAVTQLIEVVDPDPSWPSWFEQLCAHVGPVVEDVVLRIEHVGSTSVPGLAAKPIIDMDLVVAADDEVGPVIDRLASIGYRWRGDLGVEGRQAFSSPPDVDLPRHHLYLVVEHTKAHIDHWLLRETLTHDPALRQRYADLKRRNQELAEGDMDFYVAAKAAFVADVLRRARAARGLPEAEYWQPDLGEPAGA